MTTVWCVPIKEQKLLYIQIPKCANTSILRSLSQIANWKNMPSEHSQFHRASKRYKEVLNNHALAKYKDYYKFTFVRNPFDRAVSCWNDKVKNKQPGFSGFAAHGLTDRNMTFPEYSKKIQNIKDSIANDHIRSQSYCVKIGGVVILDWYGKTENMEEDWGTFQKFVKENKGIDVPDVGVSNSVKRDAPNYMDYYDQQTFELIKKRYHEDLKNFNYDSNFNKES